MFKADGTPIRDPRAFVAGIEKNGYTQQLIDEHGAPIKNPSGFLVKLEREGKIPPASGSQVKRSAEPPGPPPKRPRLDEGVGGGSAPSKGGGKGLDLGIIMWKADGTPINNAERFVQGILKNGYTQPLFGKDGEEIRDPVSFVEVMQRKQAASAAPWRNMPPAAMVSPLMPVARTPTPAVNMVHRGMPMQRVGGNGDAGECVLFKADGTPIKNPAGFIAGIQKRGYNEPLYGATGSEIRDPVKWLEAYERNAERRKAENGGGGAAPTSVPRATPAFPVARQVPIGAIGAPSTGGKHKGIFQADGRPVVHPQKIMQSIESKGYTQMLYDGNGREIRDPVRYIQGMIQRGDA